MKNTSTIHFDGTSIISAKVNYWVVFHKYLTFHQSLFSLILSAKRSKITYKERKSFILLLNYLILYSLNTFFIQNITF